MDRRRLMPLVVAATVIGGGTLVGRLLGYRFGTSLVVRCRQGHLFTTIWIPGVKLKGLDFAVARFQRCPVGRHWSLVTPVKESSLTEDELRHAHERRDIPIP